MMMMITKIAVFWVEAPCSLVEGYQLFRGPCSIPHQGALMMEAARTSETLVNFYQTTRRYNTEDSHLRTHSRENLTSYMMMIPIILDLLSKHGLRRLERLGQGPNPVRGIDICPRYYVLFFR
jgi:hypothetical protein